MKEKYHSKNKIEVIGDKIRVYYRKNGYFECSKEHLDIVKTATWHNSEAGPRGYLNGKDRCLRDFIPIIGTESKCHNRITEENGVLKVWFTNGDGYFICDKEDLEVVLRRTWHKSSAGKGYAACRIDGKYTHFHTLVCKCDEGLEVDHINRNSLDNRRCNLRSVTHQMNSLNRYSSKWRIKSEAIFHNSQGE